MSKYPTEWRQYFTYNKLVGIGLTAGQVGRPHGHNKTNGTHTRMGGNTFTTSKFSLFRIVYEIELDNEMVGI